MNLNARKRVNLEAYRDDRTESADGAASRIHSLLVLAAASTEIISGMADEQGTHLRRGGDGRLADFRRAVRGGTDTGTFQRLSLRVPNGLESQESG